MEAEQLVCPYCHEDVRDAGVVKVATGTTQFHHFYYHPHAKIFMFDDRTEGDNADDTWWQCRSCGGDLPGQIKEYIDHHSAW